MRPRYISTYEKLLFLGSWKKIFTEDLAFELLPFPWMLPLKNREGLSR